MGGRVIIPFKNGINRRIVDELIATHSYSEYETTIRDLAIFRFGIAAGYPMPVPNMLGNRTFLEENNIGLPGMRLKIVDGAMVWETSKTNPFLEYAKDQDTLDSLMFMRLFSRRLHKVVSSSPHRGLHIAIQGNRTFRFQMSVNNELSVPSLAEDIERMNELASEYYKDMK